MSLEDQNDPIKPFPLDPLPEEDSAENRLWIGNIDARLTEYSLIKVLQRYGKVISFNFLFHKTGPLMGQPRGYCFVTYETRAQAQNALQKLDGKLALSKKLSVKWASSQTSYDCSHEEKQSQPKDKQTTSKSQLSVASKINAIEAKLRMMEDNREQDEVSVPIVQFLNMSKEQKNSNQSSNMYNRRRQFSKSTGQRKPYSR